MSSEKSAVAVAVIHPNQGKWCLFLMCQSLKDELCTNLNRLSPFRFGFWVSQRSDRGGRKAPEFAECPSAHRIHNSTRCLFNSLWNHEWTIERSVLLISILGLNHTVFQMPQRTLDELLSSLNYENVFPSDGQYQNAASAEKIFGNTRMYFC
jgi:hypothetical protein